MRKIMTSTAMSALLLTAACGGMPHPEPAAAPGTVGGAYIVIGNDFNLPARDGMPAVSGVPMNVDDYLDMADLDQQCWAKIKPYMPSAEKEIAAMGVRTGLGSGIGNAVGTGLGAIAAFTGVGFAGYAAYGGLAGLFGGAGSGAAAGYTQHKIAVNFAQYACMTYAINAMHRHDRLQGVAGVVPWAGPTNPKAMKAPASSARHLTDDERWNAEHPDTDTQSAPAVLPAG